jgi:hypothetical protein
MKKIVMLIVLVLLTISGVFAQVSVAGQTYYYRYVETVDAETGVRSKDDRKDVYLTFTRNSCYFSNEKGILINDPRGGGYWTTNPMAGRTFNYQSEQNNLFIFRYYKDFGHAGGVEEAILRFSKDYTRINHSEYNDNFKRILIYERADPPQKVDPSKGPEAPTQLW